MNDEDRALLHRMAGQLELLITNHLPHLEQDIRDVRAKTWWIMGTVLVGTGLVVATRLVVG